MTLLSKVNSLLATIGRFLQCPVLLIIRLYWGWQFFVTGRAHLENLDRTTTFFKSLGIPLPHLNAMMAGSTEMVGGLLLLSGLLSRFAAFALTVVMCVAFWTGDRESLNAIFSNTDKFLGSDTFPFLFASVLVFCFGPGKIALDTFVFREKKA
jgi:putative oxidoreductase